MKHILLLLSVCIIGAANAQNIKLKKGQVITINTTTTQELDMGMAGQMSNNSKSTSVMEVKDADKTNYFTTSRLKKISLSVDGMGQQQSFDSDKPEDRNSEMGKSLGDAVDKEVKITVDNSTGKITTEKKEEDDKKEEENPLAGLMSMFGDANKDGALVDVVFFVLPQGKKVGDTWNDSTEVKGTSKVFKTYTLKELNGDVAKVALATKMTGSTSTEAQGTQIDVSINSKSEGEILLNPKTSIVKKINKTTNIDGMMEVMGQSMPLSSKVVEEILID